MRNMRSGHSVKLKDGGCFFDMKSKKVLAMLFSAIFICISLNSCGDTTQDAPHEPLTIITGNRDYTEFEKEFKKRYPEINLEFISYKGKNATEYLKRLFESGDIPDICTQDVLPDAELQKKYLIDLSGYDFSTEYSASRLQECNIDGALYMLPCNYAVNGIYYNKTLFEKQGWSVPKDYAELRSLAETINGSGLNLSVTVLDSAESAFRYLFAISDTIFLRTPAGLDWEERFLAGRVTADTALRSTIEYMQEWIDIGIINGDRYYETTEAAYAAFTEGFTAFLITGEGFRLSQNEDGSGDSYGILPWFSRDGSGNRYIINTACYYGLSSELEKHGNEQKLKDALKFMEFISSADGQRLLPGSNRQLLLPSSDTEAGDGYSEIMEMISGGFSAPLTYLGWEKLIVPVGNECMKWYAGESDGKQVINVMNRALQSSLKNETGSLMYVTKDMTLEETARLVGKTFAEATNADCALVSLGGYHDGKENEAGVNGRLFKGTVDDIIFCTINPLGWLGTIKKIVGMSGINITSLAEKGFDLYGDGNTFPYVLTVIGDAALDPAAQYTVVICGYTDDSVRLFQVIDTGISGMDALRDYFSVFPMK